VIRGQIAKGERSNWGGFSIAEKTHLIFKRAGGGMVRGIGDGRRTVGENRPYRRGSPVVACHECRETMGGGRTLEGAGVQEGRHTTMSRNEK